MLQQQCVGCLGEELQALQGLQRGGVGGVSWQGPPRAPPLVPPSLPTHLLGTLLQVGVHVVLQGEPRAQPSFPWGWGQRSQPPL